MTKGSVGETLQKGQKEREGGRERERERERKRAATKRCQETDKKGRKIGDCTG